jgi:hypothetical protein
VSRARAARLIAAAATSLAILAAFAPSALAADGDGLWGPTNDKVVTYWSFGVLIFFAVLVTVLSLVQGRLDSRKERRRQELERLRPPAAD